jgi:hypothetical protein
MKPILIILLLCACHKQNLYKATWRIEYFRDTTLLQNSARCDTANHWYSDTTLYYNSKPEETVTDWREVSVDKVVFIPRYYRELENGVWERIYFIYKEKLSN